MPNGLLLLLRERYMNVKPREFLRALQRMGFRLLRKSKGSHWQFEHPDGRADHLLSRTCLRGFGPSFLPRC